MLFRRRKQAQVAELHVIADLESLAEGAVDEVYGAIKAAVAPYIPEVEVILHQLQTAPEATPAVAVPEAEPPKVEVAPAKVGAPLAV